MTPFPERNHKGSILVIHDEPANLNLLFTILLEDGYAVHESQLDLESQLRFVKHTLPDLVLVDLRKPGMDGYQVCAGLKNDPATRAIPVIFIGSIDRSINQAKALVSGAVDYVTDPFDAEEILWRIETHVSLRRLREKLESVARNHGAQPLECIEDLEAAFQQIHILTQVTGRKHAEEKVRQTAREQARQAGVRADVSAAFSRPTHLGEILRGCTEAIVRHLDASFARIWMLNKDESMLELQASAGMYTRLDGSYSRIPVGDLKVGAIARDMKAHLTNDVMNDPRVNDKGWAQSNGMVAFAGYPLVVENRLIGVVALFARRPLSESNLDTLASVADTIAQGIERKRAEEKVHRSEAVLAQAQRLSKTGSFITDLLGDEHNWSEELRRIFEIDPATRITSEEIRALFHPEDLRVYEEAFKRAVDADQDIDITYRIITPAGKVKHLHAVSHLMEKSASQPVYIGAIQDVTESKIAEQALTRARAELAHMSRVTTLSTLTASIAHEINQPIAAAITSAGACLRWLNRDQPDVQRARDAAMRIEDDGKRAAEIISHLKSFYKKDVSPQRETVSVNHLVEEMLVLLRSEAERHSVVMHTELAEEQLYVSADRVQLQQVLMNLMLNGMESMSERGGELKISTRREGEHVIVSVTDTGQGIPAHQMEQIFKAFVTTKAGGTGMGLAISNTIIEAHSGRLWATANLERGATFHFTLPTEREAQSEQ